MKLSVYNRLNILFMKKADKIVAVSQELVDEMTKLGAKGYTISDSRGRGVHGVRRGDWRKEGNIRIEVIGDADLCNAIIARLKAEYEFTGFFLVLDLPPQLAGSFRVR